MKCCLYEIPDPDDDIHNAGPGDEENGRHSHEVDENTALLAQSLSGTMNSAKQTLTNTGSKKRYQLLQSISRLTMSQDDDEEDEEEDPTKPFVTLNALEIAAVADAKRFLSQHVVQKIVTGIWNGDIVFWDSEYFHPTNSLPPLLPPASTLLRIREFIGQVGQSINFITIRIGCRLGKTAPLLQQSNSGPILSPSSSQVPQVV